jgi:hypothetical protein
VAAETWFPANDLEEIHPMSLRQMVVSVLVQTFLTASKGSGQDKRLKTSDGLG